MCVGGFKGGATEQDTLTISIDVIVTRVTLAIVVGVLLVDVGNIGAIITGVTKRVRVSVLLVFVGHKPAVILKRHR